VHDNAGYDNYGCGGPGGFAYAAAAGKTAQGFCAIAGGCVGGTGLEAFMTEAMALTRFKSLLGEMAWTIWLGLMLGVGFAFGWWLIGTLT
jgi:hypothetical protein